VVVVEEEEAEAEADQISLRYQNLVVVTPRSGPAMMRSVD